MTLRTCPSFAAALAAVWLSVPLAHGGVPLVATSGFEAPTFVPGNIVDQAGWKTAGNGASTAVVQDNVVFEGDQAVRIDRAPNSDRRWAVPNSGIQSGRFVTISWNMMVDITQPPDAEYFGPFFGVEAYDSFENFGVLGLLGVDATSGEVLVQMPVTGFLEPTGFLAATNTWNHFEMILDFELDQYTTYFNGDFLRTLTFVDGNLGLDEFTDADMATFASAGDAESLAQSGTAWFDNFLVTDGLPGDFNGDNVVDAADYTVWRDQLGSVGTVESPAGDGNGDLVVDAADYQIWRQNFGRSGAGLPALAASTTAVPEPSSLAALLGLCALLASSRHVAGSTRVSVDDSSTE
jgi:hypothetical protein